MQRQVCSFIWYTPWLILFHFLFFLSNWFFSTKWLIFLVLLPCQHFVYFKINARTHLSSHHTDTIYAKCKTGLLKMAWMMDESSTFACWSRKWFLYSCLAYASQRVITYIFCNLILNELNKWTSLHTKKFIHINLVTYNVGRLSHITLKLINHGLRI